MAIESGFDQPYPVVVVGHVASHRHCPRELAGQLVEALGPAGGEHDVGPGRVQHAGEAGADAARRAGHDRHSAVDPKGGQDVEGRAFHESRRVAPRL